jgi:hypothetical protein
LPDPYKLVSNYISDYVSVRQSYIIFFRYLLILLFAVLSFHASAQLQIKHFSSFVSGQLDINELQDIQVNNLTKYPQIISIICTVSDSKGTNIGTYKMLPVLVKPGTQPYFTIGRDTSDLIISNDSISKYYDENGYLPPGKYKLNYTGTTKYSNLKVQPLTYIKTATDGLDGKGLKDSLAGKIRKVKIQRFNTGPNLLSPNGLLEKEKQKTDSVIAARKRYFEKIKKELKKPNLAFKGIARLSYGYTDNPGPTNLMPNHYLMGEVIPKLSVYNIPLTGRVFYTYDPVNQAPTFNQFNIEFDRQQFMNGLLQRLQGAPGGISPNQLNPGIKIADPRMPDLSASTLLNPITQQFANSNMNLNSFSDFDKTIIQKYRYDQEGLMRYKDSLQWTDPAKAKQIGFLTQQLDFMNNLRLLEQKDAARAKAYEDSLSKTDPEKLAKLKEGQADNMLQKMEKNQWPDDPSKLAQVMPMSKAEKFLYNIHSLSFGKSYLNYTPMSIMGVSVTGADASYASKYVYVQGTYGTLDMKQSLWFQNDFSQKYTVTGAKIGWGSPEKSHIHFIYLDFEPKNYKPDTVFANTIPVKNTLIGTEAVINPLKSLSLRFEYLKSISVFQGVNGNASSEMMNDSAISRDPLSHDAIRFSSVYQSAKTGTAIMADINRIGAEYHTLGNPYFRNNVYNYGFKLNQSFFKRMLTLRAGYKEETDNIVHFNNISTYNTRLDGGFMLAVPQLPLISVNYTPLYFYQKTSKDQSYQLYSTALNLNASASYQAVIKGYKVSSSLLFSHITNENSFTATRLDVYNYMINESVAIGKFSSLNGLFSYTLPAITNDSLKMLTIDFSYAMQIKKMANELVGLKLNRSMNQNLYYIYSKTGFQIAKNYSGNIYLYYNIIHPADTRSQNNMIQVSISAMW